MEVFLLFHFAVITLCNLRVFKNSLCAVRLLKFKRRRVKKCPPSAGRASSTAELEMLPVGLVLTLTVHQPPWCQQTNRQLQIGRQT